jgi:hypothetical protein
MPTAKPPTTPTPERLSSSVVSVVESEAVISRAGDGKKVPAAEGGKYHRTLFPSQGWRTSRSYRQRALRISVGGRP